MTTWNKAISLFASMRHVFYTLAIYFIFGIAIKFKTFLKFVKGLDTTFWLTIFQMVVSGALFYRVVNYVNITMSIL